MPIAAGKRMLIVADYDCDARPPCAVGMRALSALERTSGISFPTASSSATG